MAEDTIAVGLALAVAAVNFCAAVLGAWTWWQVRPSRAFWVLCRAGQAVAVLQALGAGVLALVGFGPAQGLYYLYAVLPVAIGFVAEQLRLGSAAEILERRSLEDAAAVGRLPEEQQQSVVLAIVRREMGVMAIAAVVVVFLAWRAALVI